MFTSSAVGAFPFPVSRITARRSPVGYTYTEVFPLQQLPAPGHGEARDGSDHPPRLRLGRPLHPLPHSALFTAAGRPPLMALPVFPIADATSTGCAGCHRPRVCGGTKERDARVVGVSALRREGRAAASLLECSALRLSPSSSAPSPLPSLKQQKREGDEDKQKYYVNMGYAIRTLREELPVIFYREPSFDIYREDVVFKDPLNTFVGIKNYRRIFWALRLCGRMLFKVLWIDIVSVWQPADNIVMIRWIVHGAPRVPWESHSRFDATSEYKLDSNGKIFEHRVDNVAINSPRKFHVLAVEELIQALGCPSTPGPTYFEMASSPLADSWLPFTVGLPWVRYYLALHLALASLCAAPHG